MAKGSVITQELFQAVKQLQKIHKNHLALTLAHLQSYSNPILSGFLQLGPVSL